MNNNVDRFIEKYKELEVAVRTTYGIDKGNSVSYYLTQQNKFSKYKDDILLCSDTRNLIQHGRHVNDGFVVQPTDQMIHFMDSLISKIKNRQRCGDVMVPISEVYWQKEQGKISDAIKIMKEKTYTHVPILDERKVIGVFDENALFWHLSEEKEVSYNEESTFSSIKKYLSLEGREGESFLFAKKGDYVDVIEDRINEAFKERKRIGMVFITETGDKTGKLQGILTPWDIIASYKEI